MTFPLSDNPPIAAIPDGGANVKPPVLDSQPHKYKYESVQGFFIQTGPKPKHVLFEELLTRSFGLIDTSPERWWNLRRDIQKLQDEAEQGVKYKVLFLGRHGEGWHNYAVDRIGVEPWEAHWTFQNTNGVLTWGPDPALTPKGISQARAIQSCWRTQIPLGAPVGRGLMKWYCSPLTRTGETCLESWGEEVVGGVAFLGEDEVGKGILDGDGKEVVSGVVGGKGYGDGEGEGTTGMHGVTGKNGLGGAAKVGGEVEVWEDWREVIGSHTCDKRSSKSVIQERFPTFRIEKGFSEEDVLWTTDWRESDEEMQVRGRRALDRVFEEGGAEETYISITSHSAIFANLLVVLGHQPYPLATGEMIPVVVRATSLGANGTNGH